MNIRKFILPFLCVLLILSLSPNGLLVSVLTANPASTPLLKEGSREVAVKELQGRLKYLGYFKSDVTGYYGPVTKKAVSWFQTQFGLKHVDGITGKKTWEMLRKATKKYNPATIDSTNIPRSSSGFSQNDLNLLARAVYSEARGEPYNGQVSIAAVILNRLRDSRFPNTVSGVIFQPSAFTAVADGQFWGLTPNSTAKKAVQDAINGWDPTNGAVYYFNPVTATSKWIWSRQFIKKIGKHRFCK